MKQILYIIMTIALLAACHDNFDIEKTSTEAKLVVYCFPHEGDDTTFIDITRSRTVQNAKPQDLEIDAARLTVGYSVNGISRAVGYDEKRNTFFTTGSHKAGDRVEISVSEPSLGSAMASATVPESIPIRAEKVISVTSVEPDATTARTFMQVQATFTDPADSHDYYAVRVREKKYTGYGRGIYTDDNGETTIYPSDYEDYLRHKAEHPEFNWSYELVDSIYTYPDINIHDEPLLNTLTSMDEDFGYENNFYGKFYIFSDEKISGQTYTLHLNVQKPYHGERYSFMSKYQVALYRLSPEFYRYLKSVNELYNNDLATAGLSQITPTYSNMRGGIGVLGTHNISWTEFMEPPLAR